MAAPKKKPDEDFSIDDLLQPEETDVSHLLDLEESIPETSEVAGPPQLTAEQIEIAAIRAELSAPVVAAAPARPAPDVQLTADQRELRDLRDQMAKRKAAEYEAAEDQLIEAPEGADTILIHFVEDGFTAMGTSWYRGQELEFEVGGLAYQNTKDRFGQSWVDLAGDVDTQYERWGREMFRPGPWRGKKWGDTSNLTDPTEIADAKKAAEDERKRRRAAPVRF